jgi:hypothetical protein
MLAAKKATKKAAPTKKAAKKAAKKKGGVWSYEPLEGFIPAGLPVGRKPPPKK